MLTEDVRNFFRNFDALLAGALHEGVRLQLTHDFSQREIDQFFVVGVDIVENARGGNTAQFTNRHFHTAVRELLQDLLFGNGKADASNAPSTSFSIALLGNILNYGH